MKYMNKSIEELHELLKEGKVTERELIDESLELSKKVEEENNAFVTILDNCGIWLSNTASLKSSNLDVLFATTSTTCFIWLEKISIFNLPKRAS